MTDKATSRREEFALNSDKHEVRHDDHGRIKSSVAEGSFLLTNARHKAKTEDKSGQGAPDDHHAR